MVKALVWKDWRRLRALRWTLVGIGLALPLAFSLAAWAAGHGYAMQAFSGYSLRTILLEAVPAALCLGLWPLSAMVFIVQAFTADRAEGTESFLLDRPVPRSRVWAARGTASMGSLAAVVLVGLAMVLLFMAGYPEAGRSLRNLVMFGIPGAVLMVATVTAGLGATSLVSAPLPAFLLALLFTASPVLAGVGGSLIFPYARWQGIPLAGAAACALGLAMPLASWMADTRGEPAGRGRRLRSALVLSGALVLSTIGFVIAAPFAVRADAPMRQLSVVAPPSGKTTLITGERGYRGAATRRTPSVLADGPAGFLVDLQTGRQRAFLAPEVLWAQWDSTGSKLAIVDNARPFGGVGASRLRFLDTDGRELWPSIPEPDGVSVRQVTWAGERVVVLYEELQKQGLRVAVLDPATGRQTTVAESSGASLFASLHALEDGRVFLSGAEARTGEKRALTKEDWANAVWSLRPVDVEQARLGAPVLEWRGFSFPEPGLSPSGRYWMRWNQTTSEVVEIGTGTVDAVPLRVRPTWLRDDTLVWLDHASGGWTLHRMFPGEAPRVWAKGTDRFATLHPSPDGTFAFVLARSGCVLCRAGSDTPRSIEGLVAPHMQKVEWAGAHTLASTGDWSLSLYDVETGRRTAVLGR